MGVESAREAQGRATARGSAGSGNAGEIGRAARRRGERGVVAAPAGLHPRRRFARFLGMRRFILVCPWVWLLAGLGLTGCTTMPKPPTVAHVDLDRYMGRWFVISHVPYFLERGKVASSDYYARRPDGRLVNNFTFREGAVDGPEKTWEGVAWVTDTTTNATWKVRFVWPFAVTSKIYALDPDYRWAAVGTDDAKLLWILARERSLEPADYERALAGLRAKGIDVSGLAFVPQPAGP